MIRYTGALIALVLAACSQPATNTSQDTASTPAPPLPGTATPATRAANAALADRLPLQDSGDFDDAARGLIAQIDSDAIRDEAGNIVWPIAQYAGVAAGEAPDTVNPSLWRQSQLTNLHGLFEVAEGIWQVRGYDLAVMSVIEGETGWIIIDPLLTRETAAAALQLVNDTLGARPVTGLLYTHSHADHFGGARGVLDEADASARNVPILAPIGFSRSTVAENLLAGNHMTRRAALMFGNGLPIDASGKVSVGLGPGLSVGTLGLLPPTEEIAGRGTRRVIDGVVFEFIDAAGTEAPAEFMFWLPQKKALCTAEVATATFHNALTPRGAKVRDLRLWSEAIDHVLAEYGDEAELVFASHHWPTWGQENVAGFLRGQRDIYRYTHDQALRRANRGQVASELAEELAEPPVQSNQFDTRGYYGTLNHNAKAVYQFYFGWWGGVPAEYHAHPPQARAQRLVRAMGGMDAVIAEGQRAFEAGDYRWAADVFNQAVFTDPSNTAAREWLAASYEQMGFQAESGAWRSYFLSGARELRDGAPAIAPDTTQNDFIAGVPTRDLFDALAVRYAPEKLDRAPFMLDFVFTDTNETMSLDIGTATAFPRTRLAGDDAAARLELTRSGFNDLITGTRSFPQLVASGDARLSGDPTAIGAFFAALETPPANFNIVEP